MTRSGLERFARSLSTEDEVVVDVIVANPLQVKAIAHAHVKTDAGVLASLRAAGFLTGGLAA